jgi:hypothetical protein
MDIFRPLQLLADWLIFGVFGLEGGSRLGQSLDFFVYDTLKIVILLLLINYLMAATRYWLPIEKMRDLLASRKWYGLDHLLAALFGTITPFCSCSSIPLFAGFLGAGIPLGVTLSFLITSPLVNVAAVAVLAGLFGWKITGLYVAACVLLGVVGGAVLGRLKLEKQVVDYIWKSAASRMPRAAKKESAGRLALSFWKEGWAITVKIIPYVLMGIGVGAAIHGYVPTGYFEEHISADNLLAVPTAVVLAVPLYANAIGVIPVVQALAAKGVPLGTSLAFMMAVVGLSLPEALILKRVMKLRLLLAFFGLTSLNIIIVGYLFNALV